MGRGTICLLVLGLASVLNAAELGLDNLPQSEIKEIEAEIEKGNVPPDFTPSDKTKRGVAKLSNADNPSFNHLTSTSSGSSTVKTSTSTGQTPYRYVYNNQYYQSNPYISYIQSPHAAQIAAQYSFQPSTIAHYLHTPTQIQYVSSPALASRYQTVSNKVGGAAVSASSTGTSSSGSQYQITPAQQVYVAPQALYQTQSSSASAHQTAASGNQYQASQQLYYHQQQPIVMLLVQPQPNPAALLYPVQQQQHQAAYVLGQQPFYNVFGNHRFSLPYAAVPNSQVTYLVPMAIPSTSTSQSISALKATADKTTPSIQSSSSGVSYGVRTNKA